MEIILPTDEGTSAFQESSIDDIDKMNFDLSPDNTRGKLVITGHGAKGSGKTYGLFLITTGRIGGFPSGKTAAVSFDNKTKIIRDQFFANDNITVYDGKRYYDEDPNVVTRSGMVSYRYIVKLLDDMKQDPPDWIVFDGFTIMSLIFEMAMRYYHGLKATQGTANRNVWKDRRRYIQDIHNRAIRVAKYGVAYLTYSDKDEIVIDGDLITKEDVPHYVDVVMQETDIVLKMTKTRGKDGDLFYLRVESTKYKQYLDGNGNPIQLCETTLSQGRTFNITGMSETQVKKTLLSEKQPVQVKKTLLKEEDEPILEEIKKDTKKEEPKKKEEKKSEIKFEVPDLLNL